MGLVSLQSYDEDHAKNDYSDDHENGNDEFGVTTPDVKIVCPRSSLSLHAFRVDFSLVIKSLNGVESNSKIVFRNLALDRPPQKVTSNLNVLLLQLLEDCALLVFRQVAETRRQLPFNVKTPQAALLIAFAHIL